MTKHHTKTKGDIGVLKVKADLAEKGCLVLSPETEHAPFDVAIYKNGEFKRIQVKYRTLRKNGSILVSFRSSWSDKNGTHIVKIDKDNIDIYAVYCPQTRKCYYFNPDDFGSGVSLRVEPPKNEQTKGIHLAIDYENLPA